MKKICYSFLLLLSFVSCKEVILEDDFEKESFLDCFVGNRWIYDHPEIPTWEEWNVFGDGVMYYSNATSFLYEFSNEDVACRYVYNAENGAISIVTESLGTVEGLIVDWDKYEFTMKTVDGSFSYSRLLGTIEVTNGEELVPSYDKLISDARITGFSSHNPKIADVDDSGKVYAQNYGRTYIDIITDKGTAVIEINVEGFFNVDYASLLFKTMDEVTGILGNPNSSEIDRLEYTYDNGGGYGDDATSKTNAIQALLDNSEDSFSVFKSRMN